VFLSTLVKSNKVVEPTPAIPFISWNKRDDVAAAANHRVEELARLRVFAEQQMKNIPRVQNGK
jgi:hypothetical protein